MKAIIPAAGSGTRLFPITYTIPKPMVYLAGKPILGHILDNLKNSDFIDSIGFIVGDKSEIITKYVGKNYPKFRIDHVYQEERKGLGHAIYLYLKEKSFSNDPVLIVLSDTIFEADINEILDSEYSSIGVHEVGNPKDFGVVEVGTRFIKGLEEKSPQPKSKLAIVGVYLIKNVKLLFECLQELISKNITIRNEYQLTSALQLMLNEGEKMTTFRIEGWHDCGSKENLLKTNQHLLGKLQKAHNIPGSIIIPPVYIEDSVKIEKSIIGPYVSIADESEVTESIIRDAIVNEKARITNALIMESLIGERAVFNGQFSKLFVGEDSQINFGNQS